ncbi:aldehyde dehydrogenase [Hesseltinella vesiculosa]|uniref:Aldehyde dehydrogenase n=1 Tax=Hesseltinella vesiculosa TaxID=101127 RepID=A0A1X2GXL8_9FUNG|nr:aldehyde dehydrogenase [Hesseltinella vesiculosa]
MTLQATSFESIDDSVSFLRGQFIAGFSREMCWRRLNIERIHDMVKENEERFYEALAKDMNKPRLEAFTGDINPVLEECNIDRLVKERKVKARNGFSSGTTTVRREALGAWNFPLQLTLIPLIGAIAAGNTAIVKPSEIAPHTANLLAELFPIYLDDAKYRVVNGGVDVATALLAHRFDHIFYTGSTNVGKIIMEAAAKHVTPVTLELALSLSPKMSTSPPWPNALLLANSSTACVAPDYVLIHESLLQPFTLAFQATVKKWFGDNPKNSPHLARLISDRHFDHVAHMLNHRDSGDVVVGGDTDRAQRFIAPTLVVNVSPLESTLMDDEIFGPVLPVLTYRKLEDAVAYINKKTSPLALYIFSNKKQDIDTILSSTQSGGVLINDTMLHQSEYALPFGGVGHSGMGGYHGDKTFETFTYERAVMAKNLRLEALNRFRYPPYTSGKQSVLRMVLSTHPIVYYYKLRRVGIKVNAFLLFLLILFIRLRRR